jgi:nanoRNase/pAp phosphatase (c-di-AMP/oligoRNAs hydrolase)
VKQAIYSIAEKKRRVRRFTDAILENSEFLIVGHQRPDDDCIGSMVAIGLLIQQFDKRAYIFTTDSVGEKHHFLLEICRYNSIEVNIGIPWDRIDVIIACDTAKPRLLHINEQVEALLSDSQILKTEIDHHLGHDTEYIADEGYRLVTEASSSAEIIGYLAYKLSKRQELLDAYRIEDIFPRNFVLSVITGLVGDTNLGQFLESRQIERSYHFFSNYFNRILRRKTVRLRNFSSQEELFTELGTLSDYERTCFDRFVEKAEFYHGIGYRAVDENEMQRDFAPFDDDTIANTSRAAADSLAEASGKIGMVGYWDRSETGPFVQFRARRSPGYRDFDLRDILQLGNIDNGGGHPGAVGFRVPKKQVESVRTFLRSLVESVHTALP